MYDGDDLAGTCFAKAPTASRQDECSTDTNDSNLESARRSRAHLANHEGVSCLKGNELVEVEEDVEEDAGQTLLSLKVLQREHALCLWLHHVVHLTQHVLEKNGLLAQTLHAVKLLLIEVLLQKARCLSSPVATKKPST